MATQVSLPYNEVVRVHVGLRAVGARARVLDFREQAEQGSEIARGACGLACGIASAPLKWTGTLRAQIICRDRPATARARAARTPTRSGTARPRYPIPESPCAQLVLLRLEPAHARACTAVLPRLSVTRACSRLWRALRVGELIRGEHDAPHPSPTHSSLRSRTYFCSPPISHPHPHTPHNR